MPTITRTTSKPAIQRFQDLEVYKEGFRLAMEVFKLTQQFPREELYALTTQMRNASRSIHANLAEGWGKRRHVLIFKRHILDSIGSANEMLAWLDTALACKYVEAPVHHELVNAYEVLARRLHQLLVTWRTFR